MADGNTPLKDGTNHSAVTAQPTSDNAHPQTTSPQSTNKKAADVSESENRGQRRCGVPLFTANAGCVIWLWMIGVVYTTGVVRTLERRFGLRSTQTGMMMASGDVVHMSIVIFIGYFGRRGHKPRIMCVTALFSAVGNFVMVLPHWLYNSHAPTSSVFVNHYNKSSPAAQSAFCAVSDFDHTSLGSNGTNSAVSCDDDDLEQTSIAVHPALYFFVVAQLLVGLGGSGILVLTTPYIDENAPQTKSALYLGVVTTMFGLGPLCGNLLAAVTLKLPENISAAVPRTLRPGNARWIGCWWLGYLLVSVGTLLMSVPLWFFPSTMTSHRQHHRSSLIEDNALAHGTDRQMIFRSIWTQIKEFPRRLSRLLRNVPFIFIICANVCVTYTVIGVLANMVRYLEIAFLQPASVASVVSALSSALAGTVGGFTGGLIMSRLKLRPVGAVRLIIISSIGFTIGNVVILFLSCPQVNMAGQVDPNYGRFTVHTECSRHCACSTNRKSYDPVCGSDNLTYFSSCFAGCTHLVNETYVGCRCLSDTVWNSSWPEVRSSYDVTARPGLCVSPCSLVIVFGVVVSLASLIRSIGHVPNVVIGFRVVDFDERSFALAINSFVFYLFGFIPAPMIFGALIDSTCRLWQRDSSWCRGGGSRGSCLLFDTDLLRWRTYGVVLGFQLVQLVFVVLVYCTIRRRRFNHDDATTTQASAISRHLPTDDNDNPLQTFDELNPVEMTDDQVTVSRM